VSTFPFWRSCTCPRSGWRIHGKIPYEAILFDAGYGEDRQFFSTLDKRHERFIGRIPESHSFRADDTEMVTMSRSNRGRPRKHPVVADRRQSPLAAKRWKGKFLAEGRSFETVTLPLRYKPSAEVLAVRVREVVSQAYNRPGPRRWLLIERLGEDRFTYYVSNFPDDASVSRMMVLAHRRGTIEQGYQQLKEELGLDHFEGRSWTGLHHHIALCFMAFCFLVLLERDHL